MGGVLIIRRFLPRFPAAMVAVIAAVGASKAWDFAGHGIAVIGPVIGGLPHFALPSVTWKEVESLIGIAGSCFVMIIAQSAATARSYAERHQQRLDENADILGLSAANAAAGLSGTFVVNGSPTQTAMVESSGANSQLAQLSTSLVVALALLFLTRPLQYLPRCVLSAIVFLIAIRLIDLRKLSAIRRESPGEFALGVMTAGVVVGVGVEQGIIVAMVVSLLRIVGHSYRPHTGVLVTAGDMYWKIVPAAPGAMTRPGLAIYRFGAPLFYANAPYFAEEVHTILEPGAAVIRWLVVDAEAVTNLDYTAARVVRDLCRELATMGVTLGFARVSPFLKADFDRHGVTKVVGEQLLFARLHDALDAFEKSGRS
ncbi:MAG: SulP family inorganic anion transporter [Acetobacteraceae bacterium]|nr:SulP family inorganic anion transporter [Acetobacteraceae bacterium]